MQAVAAVTELRELRLSGTAVTGRGLALLASLSKLERLNLQGCRKLQDDAAPVLSRFNHLKSLDLKDSTVTAEAVAKIRAALPTCEILYETWRTHSCVPRRTLADAR